VSSLAVATAVLGIFRISVLVLGSMQTPCAAQGCVFATVSAFVELLIIRHDWMFGTQK